jgi:hypothetical protein
MTMRRPPSARLAHPVVAAAILAVLAVLAIDAAGCSSGSGATNAPSDGGSDGSGDALPEAPATCTVCSTDVSGDPPKPGWECIKTMNAQVVDAVDGKPVAKVTIMSCSAGACVNDVSGDDGWVHLTPCAYMQTPAFKVVGFGDWVSFAVPLRNPKDTFEFKGVPIVRLPKTGLPIKPGEAQRLTMAGVTVELAAGAKNIVIDEFSAYSDFRAVSFPVDKAAVALDPGLGFGMIFAIGPQNALLTPPAKLTVPNTKGYAPGTSLELWVHNFELLTGVPVKMGEWWKAATATVSSDGKTVTTDDGQGIPMLSVVGFRPKP